MTSGFPLNSVESLDSIRYISNLTMVGLADELNAVRTSQGYYKQWITRLLDDLAKQKTEGTLTLGGFKSANRQIENQIQKILECEDKLIQIYTRYKVAENEATREKAAKAIYDYVQATHNSLADYEADLAPAPLPPVLDLTAPVTGQQLLDAMKQMGNNSISVTYDCSYFYGNETDRLAFINWLSEFEGVLKTQPHWDDQQKLGYLKKVVLGNAAAYIAHLEPGPGNFAVAIKALKDQYLNEAFITDEYLSQLVNETPAYDPKFIKTSQYLASVRNICYNLKTHYAVDLLDENSDGYKFLSHIIFNKLNPEIRKALRSKTKNDFPTFNEIMENHMSVIENIISTRSPTSKIRAE